MIKNKLNIRWTDSIKLLLLDNEMIDLLPRAGCFRADISWSIVSPELQKLYNNIIKGEKYLINLKKLSDAGIWTHPNIIINLPYQFSIKEDLKILEKYKDYIDAITYTDYIQFHGSKLDSDYMGYGLEKIDYKVHVKGETFAGKWPSLVLLENEYKNKIKQRIALYRKNHNDYVSYLKDKEFILQKIHLYLLGWLYDTYGYNSRKRIIEIMKTADRNIRKYKFYNKYVAEQIFKKS